MFVKIHCNASAKCSMLEQWWESIIDSNTNEMIDCMKHICTDSTILTIQENARLYMDSCDIKNIRCSKYNIHTHFAHIQDYFVDAYMRHHFGLYAFQENDDNSFSMIFDHHVDPLHILEIMKTCGMTCKHIREMTMVELSSDVATLVRCLVPADRTPYIQKKTDQTRVHDLTYLQEHHVLTKNDIAEAIQVHPNLYINYIV